LGLERYGEEGGGGQVLRDWHTHSRKSCVILEPKSGKCSRLSRKIWASGQLKARSQDRAVKGGCPPTDKLEKVDYRNSPTIQTQR